ncbi:beta-L-arabinofuranosidase domain-containing protein [Streptosporangium lutulentum]
MGSLGTNNAETCCNYNMLKLSRGLFFHTADPKYMQYYERALYGQILASRRNVDSATDPLLTYFIPMRPGASRSYGNLGTCCGGTGLESHVKFQDSIYFRSADDSTLYVNLYMASVLSWPEKGFTIRQSTDYPTDPTGTTTLTVQGSGADGEAPGALLGGEGLHGAGQRGRAEAQRQARRVRHARPALEPG